MARRLFHGWYVVACCFGIALFGWGLGFYGSSVYLVRLREAQGWSAGSISAALTFYNLVMAALVAQVGDVIARFGPRRVILAGSAVLAIGAGFLPVVTALWQLYVVLFVMAAGYAVIGSAGISTILADWFEAKRGLSISLALNGASCAGVFVTPAMIWLTGRFGFAHGLWILIAILLLLLWPLVIGVLRRPRELGLWPDGRAAPPPAHDAPPPPPVRRSVLLGGLNFQTVTLAFSLGLTAQVGFLMHQVNYLTSLLGIEAAGACVAATTFTALIGRVTSGLVIDRLDPRRVAAANFMVQCSALVLFLWAPSTAAIWGACVLFGVSVGNTITLPALIVQREFPAAQFGRAISLVLAIDQVVLAFGPGLLGIVHDWSGDYSASLALCLALDIVAFAVVLVRRRPGALA